MSIYRRAMGYFIPDAVLITLLVMLIGLSVCVALLEAWPLAILIDSVLNANPRGDRVHDIVLSVLPQDRLGQILGLVLLGLALQCIGYAVWLGRMMVNAYLSARGTARVRCDLFSKLQGLGLTYHQGRPKGDATYRLMTDVAGPWGIMELVIGTGVAAVTLVIMTAILFMRSEPLTIAAFTVGPLMIASNWYFARRVLRCSLASKQADAALTSLIQQSISTVSLAQAFSRETHELGRFSAHVNRSNSAHISLSWQEQLYPFVRDAILAVSAAIIFGYGGYLVYRDQFADPVAGGMTIGALVVFIDYTRKLWDPLKWLTEFVAKVQFHAAACRRVFDVLDTPDTVEEALGAIALPLKPRALVLDRVSFGYSAGPVILHSLSAQIRPGEMVGFVGPSGTGKSTVLNMMMRAYDPTSGGIRLDDIDLRQLRFADLRRHMALVGQDHALLPLSVADNIAYGRPLANRQEIVRAAELAGAAEFIAGLPEGYDTLLCEGGQNLSGGQRQRLAIARALLTEAPILILDEPTSALDPVHEQHLIDTLRSLRGQRTIVLVTHRLESVVDCDQIYVMDAGRIIERGRHAALLAQRGRYTRLWQRVEAPDKPPRPIAALA